MVPITTTEFKKLTEFIKNNYGIYLKEEKKMLICGRLHNVLLKGGFRNFTEYYQYVINDNTGMAVNTLINVITTNHTFFMREADHFEYFKDTILPNMKKNNTDRDLRIWSAGCSSGEEAYTLAMIIDDFFGNDKKLWDTKVLATDISDKVLAEARCGKYSKEKVEMLPKLWKLKYLKNCGVDHVAIEDEIKNEVIYRKFNLMDDKFPFRKKFHVIFCRNVMIYFDNNTKNELVKKFYDFLEYGGYLFIGHSESIQREATKLTYLKPAIYQKL